MFDEEHRDPLAADVLDELHQLVLFLWIEAGRRLVEHQELGLRAKRASDLQPPLEPVGKVARVLVLVALESNKAQELPGAIADLALLAPSERRPKQRVPDLGVHPRVLPDHHVLQRRHVGKEPDVLKGAGNAQRRHGVRAKPQRHRAQPQPPADRIRHRVIAREWRKVIAPELADRVDRFAVEEDLARRRLV